jgi:hypothetical protein
MDEGLLSSLHHELHHALRLDLAVLGLVRPASAR